MPKHAPRRALTKPRVVTPLRRYRRARTPFSQETLAELLRVRQQTYSKYETGEVTPPPKQRARLAAILDVAQSELWPHLDVGRSTSL